MCCLDLGRPLEWRWGKSSLVKKCCNNPNNVPVLAPQHNLSSQELRELDKGEYEQEQAGGYVKRLLPLMECCLSPGLVYLRVYFLDLLVCDGLSYDTRR